MMHRAALLWTRAAAALMALAWLAGGTTAWAAADADRDGIPDLAERRLGSLRDRAEAFTPVLTVATEAAKGGHPRMVRLAAAHVAEDRFLWRLDLTEPVDTGALTLILYLDADDDKTTGRRDKPEVVGTDVMCGLTRGQPSVSDHSTRGGVHSRSSARVVAVGKALFVCVDVALKAEAGHAAGRVRPLLQWDGGSQSTDWSAFRIPLVAGTTKPRCLGPRDPEFKGIGARTVRAAMRGPYPERRPKPPVPFHAEPRHPDRAASVARRRIPIELAEEAGLDRKGEPVRVGLPMPQGVLFDPAQVRLLDPAGRETPAQFTVTSFWKDGSIRWLLATFLADLNAGHKATYTAELGRAVTRQPIEPALLVERRPNAIVVDTGPMEVRIDTRDFSLFSSIIIDRNGDGRFAAEEMVATSAPGGIVLRGLDGTRYAATVADARIEEHGPLATTLRLEGPYVSDAGTPCFRHTTRLTFYAGSTRVDVAHSHIDDALEHEFADFRSVEMPIRLVGGAATQAAALVPGPDAGSRWLTAPVPAAKPVRLFQRDDAAFALAMPNGAVNGTRAPGAMALRRADRTPVAVAVEGFWQNYPKALRASRAELVVELWPDIRDEKAYAELPYYLDFPFVGGGYRFKWGMSKTHRVRLAFGLGPDDRPPAPSPLVPVLPPAWYEETGALGPMVAKRPGEFEAWDTGFERAFQAHLKQKEHKREYGFFNWGDSHGERRENWTNNEYDLPHALFMQFARTGDRRLFRLALAGARHQADVDCIHAYPDPAYLGGNVVHSVCHTGEWSQHVTNRSWSFRHGYHAMAFNGHTWSEGMCEAWYLTGDARVMETAQALGEHVVYGMVPRFKKLGTHERSAGWSLVAIIALYRATLDPLYLDAARKIAEVAIREQKPGQGSGWPHRLPGDHCRHSKIPGATICTGNVAFLIGVLHSGLKEYYLASGDPRAAEAIRVSAPWWKTQWEPENDTFQYTSCPLFRGSTGALVGILSSDAVAYAYELTKDTDYLNMAARSLMANAATTHGGSGKGFAQYARFAAPVMATLYRHRNASDTVRRAITATAESIFTNRLRGSRPAAFFGIRGPESKRFFVQVANPKAEKLTVTRRTHGSRQKEKPTGTVAITDPRGKVVKQATFDTDLLYELAWSPPAGALAHHRQ